jgi:ArsR family transcriptional regulator, lead/cadmium/zinc/bismuth-responsive transcriptional repressor
MKWAGHYSSGATTESIFLVVPKHARHSAVRNPTYLADTFQMLASPTRLRIVEALSVRELCVCDLAAVVGVSQSAVSHQLRQLRQMRIVRYRKDGRMAYYRLDDPHVETLFGTGLAHVRETGPVGGSL